jgi:hypothetical protein
MTIQTTLQLQSEQATLRSEHASSQALSDYTFQPSSMTPPMQALDLNRLRDVAGGPFIDNVLS